MSEHSGLPDPMVADCLPTALAPMQDVTDLAFMRLLASKGLPDYFFTEYFRVHVHSTPEVHIVDSIEKHGTGRPVFAQMIGEDLYHLKRTVRLLQELPVAGIDLNMGCPAPKVYKKKVGGGLLRDPEKIEQIFATLREACQCRFTVKMRTGFEDKRHFGKVLDLINTYRIDCLSLHGRTVKQMYRGEVDYDSIRMAVDAVQCPVFANGNITSAEKATWVKTYTGCHGVMVGRSAIRNPWIFRQIREKSTGQTVFSPTLGDVRKYIQDLWDTMGNSSVPEHNRLNKMKKFLNFVGQGVDPDGQFLHKIRRSREVGEFFGICDTFMSDGGKSGQAFATEPYDGVVARPNQET